MRRLPSRPMLLLKVIELLLLVARHTCMDQEKIQETEEKVKNWLADKQHRKCCKAAMYAANTVILIGLTAGLTLLWVNELRKAGRHNCCTTGGDK